MRKRFLAIAIAALALIVPVLFSAASVSAAQSAGGKITDSDKYLLPYLTAAPDRTYASNGEAAAAQYLADTFAEISGGEIQPVLTAFTLVSDTTKSSQNVSAALSGAGTEYVIIGAHIDNYYTSVKDGAASTNAEGAFDNGTGISLLLRLFEYYFGESQKAELPFNMVFAAFGAQGAGFEGSAHYLKNLPDAVRANTLLYVNFDSVGAGDYLYAYFDETKTALETLAEDVLADSGIRLPPANKRTLPVATVYTPYLHYGISSDNLVFMHAGIPSLNLFSGNWENSGKYGNVESENHSVLAGSAQDNFAKLIEYYPDYADVMNSAANAVIELLALEGFPEAAKSSAPAVSFFNSQIWAQLLKLAVIAVFIVVAILLYSKYKKITPPQPAPRFKIAVFGSEYENPPDLQAEIDRQTTDSPPDIFSGY